MNDHRFFMFYVDLSASGLKELQVLVVIVVEVIPCVVL